MKRSQQDRDFQQLVWSIPLPIICTLGICGNILAALVLRKIKGTSPLILLVLSISDALLLLSLMFTYTMVNFWSVFKKDRYSLLVGSSIVKVLQTYQSCITVFVGVDRCIAVLDPLSYASKMKRKKIILWVVLLGIFSVAFASPTFFARKVVQGRIPKCKGKIIYSNLTKLYHCDGLIYYDDIVVPTKFGVTKFFAIYASYVNATVVRILPIIILIVTSFVIVTKLSLSATRLRKMQRQRGASDNVNYKELSITFMVLANIIVFVSLYTPVTINSTRSHLEMDYSYKLFICTPVLVALNSFLNFFIYYLSGELFRKTLHGMICCCKCYQSCRRSVRNRNRQQERQQLSNVYNSDSAPSQPSNTASTVTYNRQLSLLSPNSQGNNQSPIAEETDGLLHV